MTEDYENEGNFPDVRTIFMAIGPAFKANHNHTWIKLVDEYQVMMHALCANATGKSLSEVLILASTNPQYDKRLSFELPVQYMKIPSLEYDENMRRTRRVQKLFFVFVTYVHNMFYPCSPNVLSIF
jgi:hypothetical protein